ncbi:MAG: 1-(5-phosphoribosyl)-5-[Clostridia bacterium]|nr:1-(5-phosphoribosyl)-5-[(5-phosphoribosylamino)methylideneamino]imidazole-4-carboxamide isomerase [Clostridia bacterium]MBQ5905927.1 1-(5-phosphoribosyl)-5-[(5-phosphoribosylamino)methylideneamino]imidazole-4-carboxamide isomerase [Clostridia bacterium]
MLILPAIDLYEKKAVRLYKGDYDNMTVYSENPLEVAHDFENAGATFIHLVDLEGAKFGTTPNLDVVRKIVEYTKLDVEIGGGIRDDETVQKYIDIGVRRVILGTAAVTDDAFLRRCVERYKDSIAVGVDIKDGFVAIKGWTEKSQLTADEFFAHLSEIGVKTVICTDISKDGAMKGTNRELYKELSGKYSMDIVASGGVSDLEDIKALNEMNLYGAIVGKAYYIGAINLKEAIEVAK